MSLKRSGLVFSWPVTTPFAIISVDIWSPGEISSVDGDKYLFGAMCDMTQFAVIQGYKNKESSTIAHLLMEGVLLKFGLCLMVICDQGSEHRKFFEKACAALNIRIHTVAKRNHRAVGVERFFKFMLPAQKLCAEERKTPKAFVECGVLCPYAWNATCIDGTDIPRSIPAIGRELRFPLDITLADIPLPTDNPGNKVAHYLRLLGDDVQFAQKLTGWLTDDRRMVQRERHNKDWQRITYEVGDLVMAQVARTSKSDKEQVQKMMFGCDGPFIIAKVDGPNSYSLRRFNKPQSALQKFSGDDLYLLPKQEYIRSLRLLRSTVSQPRLGSPPAPLVRYLWY